VDGYPPPAGDSYPCTPAGEDKGGCKLVLVKLVLVKTGNGDCQEKTQPPESPFFKGDLNGIP